MKRRVFVFAISVLDRLYGGRIDLLVAGGKYLREKHRNNPDFMKDCSHCKGLDFCLTCPGFESLYKGKS